MAKLEEKVHENTLPCESCGLEGVVHADDCPFIELFCDMCDQYVCTKDFDDHENKCGRAEIPCAYCNELVVRSKMHDHEIKCIPQTAEQLPCMKGQYGAGFLKEFISIGAILKGESDYRECYTHSVIIAAKEVSFVRYALLEATKSTIK
ncbi:MAG: hypothetical protein Edafosvirus1_50 [Edafosvirus sp.]|uniref:TRAF-type domain-containing protein n=1 Tax=Edafosvirus sp. TaxID=2487765 RepID=A0A3G4ZWB2_9VIRU|nr:MAG: hypothetical protein Edafosvirus1_50 [Edafosvirus sp.]